MRTKAALLALSIIIYTPLTHALKVYKWVDEDGQVHYSDRRPTQSTDDNLRRWKLPSTVTTTTPDAPSFSLGAENDSDNDRPSGESVAASKGNEPDTPLGTAPRSPKGGSTGGGSGQASGGGVASASAGGNVGKLESSDPTTTHNDDRANANTNSRGTELSTTFSTPSAGTTASSQGESSLPVHPKTVGQGEILTPSETVAAPEPETTAASESPSTAERPSTKSQPTDPVVISTSSDTSKPSPTPSSSDVSSESASATTSNTDQDGQIALESEKQPELEVIIIADTEPPQEPEATFFFGEEGIVAFPGAEGFGALSKGGRGGRVIQVTNLNDRGPGSLRACVEASGPRNCIFRVSGYIDLDSEIIIEHPYLTIAGQTAPGGGIYLRMRPGNAEGINGLIEFKRFKSDHTGEVPHDVIIRYIRFRHGRSPTMKGNGTRPKHLEIWSGYNIMIDHISSGWVQDNLMTVIARDEGGPEVRDISVQRSLFAESLDGHSTGMNIQGQGDESFQRVWNISVHHNLFANNSHRNPRSTSNGAKVVNNVVYNWGNRVGSTTRGSIIDWLNNYWKAGPMSNIDNALFHQDRPSVGEEPYPWTPSIYIAGNVAPNLTSPYDDNWPLITLPYDNFNLLPRSFERGIPLPQAPVPIKIESADEAYDSVLSDVGANARLDCDGSWIANSDPIDSRVIHEVVTDSGPSSPIIHQDDVGGWPRVSGGVLCGDSDADGMPNVWETLNGLDPNNGADGALDADGDGYTNLEEYLNGTI